MPNKRMKDLKNLTNDELKVKVREFEAKMFDSRMRLATGQLENTSSLWLMRKDISRMKFLLGQKSGASQKA